MNFIKLNIILFLGLFSLFIFFNFKKTSFTIFFFINFFICYYVFNNLKSQNGLINVEFSSIFSDPLSIYLIFLTSIISLVCILWIIKSNIWNQLLLVILITEICLIQIFSTKNLLLFYVFFELSALPLLFLIISKGPTFRKSIAFNYFLGYTLLGSIFFFISLTIIYASFGSFDLNSINFSMLSPSLQTIVWFCFLITFFIKVPVLPFHLWLLEAHVEAPTLGSVILAALLLKIGGYGLFRFCIISFPEVSLYWSPLIITTALTSMLYSTFTAFVQLDIKRIVAYSSIAHMNASVIGLFSFNIYAIYGSILNMIAHGFTSAALFFLIGILYRKFHTKNITYYGGLATFMPYFHFYFLFFILSNIAFPGTFNFICELLILIGLNSWSTTLAIIFIIANSFVFLYCILLLSKICYGEICENFSEIIDINKYEFLLLFCLAVLTIFFGIFTEYCINSLEQNIRILYLKLG